MCKAFGVPKSEIPTSEISESQSTCNKILLNNARYLQKLYHIIVYFPKYFMECSLSHILVNITYFIFLSVSKMKLVIVDLNFLHH